MEIVKYSDQWFQPTINLLEHLWHHLSPSQRAVKFMWRYLQNPHTANPFIALAVENGQVAGFRAFVGQRFVLNHQPLMVFSPADAVVNPAFRRLGLFSKLNRALIADVERYTSIPACILNLSSNRLSTPGYLKLGWQSTAFPKRYAYGLSPLLKVFGRGQGSDLSATEVGVSDELHSGALSLVWQQRVDAGCITPLHDELWYRWRYSEPGKSFLYVYARVGDRLSGWLIAERAGRNQIVVLEHSADSPVVLNHLAQAAARHAGAWVVRFRLFADSASQQLVKAGCLAEPSLLLRLRQSRRLPALVRPVASDPVPADWLIHGTDIRKASHWTLSQSEVH